MMLAYDSHVSEKGMAKLDRSMMVLRTMDCYSSGVED